MAAQLPLKGSWERVLPEAQKLNWGGDRKLLPSETFSITIYGVDPQKSCLNISNSKLPMTV